MKHHLVLGALVSFIGLGGMSIASSVAQEAGVWTHPSGAYSLNYGAIGWKLGSPYSYGGRTTLATFDAPGRGGNSRNCLIFEGRIARLGPGVDQATANASMAIYTRDEWGSRLGLDPSRIHYFSNGLSGPVQVASIAGDTSGRDSMRLHYRTFIIATPAGAVHHELSCTVSPYAGKPAQDEIAAILASLTFAAVPANE
jgi:hypothetical protein